MGGVKVAKEQARGWVLSKGKFILLFQIRFF